MKNLDCNKKYELVRSAVVSAFANDNYREVNHVDCDKFPEIMHFVRDMYYAYWKYAEKSEV